MAAAPLSPPSLARLGERATVAPRGRLQLIPKATIGFPAEVCESERGEMEKRSRQRVRDQVARLAFGAETRMRSSARGLSMMAKEHKRSFGPDTEAQDQSSPDRHFRLATRGRSIQMGHNRTHAQPQSRSSVPSSAPEGSGSASATKVDEYRYDCCVQDGT
jgi:hypothetical protein